MTVDDVLATAAGRKKWAEFEARADRIVPQLNAAADLPAGIPHSLPDGTMIVRMSRKCMIVHSPKTEAP